MRPIKTASANRGFGLALVSCFSPYHFGSIAVAPSNDLKHSGDNGCRTCHHLRRVPAAPREGKSLGPHSWQRYVLHPLLSHPEIVWMHVRLVSPYTLPLLSLAHAADSNVQFTTWPSSSTRQVKSHHGCPYIPPLRVFILLFSTLVGKKSSSQKPVSARIQSAAFPLHHTRIGVLTPYGNRQGRNRILRRCRPLGRGS